MALKELAALYGRVCLIVAAFALVAGIIAGPIVQKILFPSSTSYARNGSDPSVNPMEVQEPAIVEKQG